VIAGVRPIKLTLEQKVQTYMATKINNLEYDELLEVRNWRHSAEIGIVHEVENGTVYTVEVYTDGSKIEERVGAAGVIFVNGILVHLLMLVCVRDVMVWVCLWTESVYVSGDGVCGVGVCACGELKCVSV